MRSQIAFALLVGIVLLMSSASASPAAGVQRRLLAASRHLLADAQVAQCEWDTADKMCGLNFAAAFSVSAAAPNSVAKAALLIAAQSYTCSQYNDSTTCGADSSCSFSQAMCDIQADAISETLMPTLLCSGSKAYYLMTCSALTDQTNCTAMSGCTWYTPTASKRKLSASASEAMCISTDYKNAISSTDKTAIVTFLADWASYSSSFWGTCDGPKVLKAAATACNITTQTACQGNDKCRWKSYTNATTDESGNSCSLTQSGGMTILLGDNDFSKALVAIDTTCRAKTTQADCAAVTKVTINTDKVAEAKKYKPTNAGFIASVPVSVVALVAIGVGLLI
eukprot:jgi/Chrzof1/10012/Cz04g24030.t1